MHAAGADLLGLAVIEYKQKHRAFPPDLQALGVQDLVGPFTGEQFFYSPRSHWLSSLQRGACDLSDDRGRKYDYKEKTGDSVWRCEGGAGASEAISG